MEQRAEIVGFPPFLRELEAWRKANTGMTKAAISKTLMMNELVDMEWKFGVTASSDDKAQVGSTFLQLKLVLNKAQTSICSGFKPAVAINGLSKRTRLAPNLHSIPRSSFWMPMASPSHVSCYEPSATRRSLSDPWVPMTSRPGWSTGKRWKSTSTCISTVRSRSCF